MRSSVGSIVTRLNGYVAYTFVGSGIAGFCDGTLQSCTLAKPSHIAYDPSREAFFVLDQQLTHGLRVITKDLGVHTLSWQPDCALRAPRSLAILNNILLVADTGNGSVKYLLLTNYFKINQKRSTIQFCSSTCGVLRTLSLDVTQPVDILPYSPTSFLVLDAVQRSVKLVLLDIFLEQPSGEALLAVQAVETLYVGVLRLPSNMIDLYKCKYLLVSDKASLVVISTETKRGIKFRLKCHPSSVSQINGSRTQSKNEPCSGQNTRPDILQSYLSEPKHISGLSAYQVSSTQEIIFLADSYTHMLYYAILDLQSILDSLVTERAPEESMDDCYIDVYQLTNPVRRSGYLNGILKKAEFSNPQGTLAFTLDGQLCVSVCDTGNSVIRLVGPDFLRQEKEQPAYLQVQANNHDLIQGKVRTGVDKHFLALRRVLQQTKVISTSNATIKNTGRDNRMCASTALPVPSLLRERHEHNKQILHHYLAKANIAHAIDRDMQLDVCRLESLNESDTPSLASEDPLTAELESIEKSAENITQVKQTRRRSPIHKIPQPSSMVKTHADASVQYESEKTILTADRSIQVLFEVEPKLRHKPSPNTDSPIPESPVSAQDSLVIDIEAPEIPLACHTSDKTKWEFQIIGRTWSIVHSYNENGSLIKQLDDLMDENHLFDIHQKVTGLSATVLAKNDSRLTKSFLQLAFLFFKQFSNLDEYTTLYQSLSFPKKFKPSIKCLMLLQCILTSQLIQLSDSMINEILLPLTAQRWFSSTTADINYLSLLGWGNGWAMIFAIKLMVGDIPVPITRPSENRLSVCTSGHTIQSAFALDSNEIDSDLRLSIIVIVADERFEGRRVFIKITNCVEIIALENCKLTKVHNQKPCKPVLSSHLSVPLTSATGLVLKVSCADMTIRTQVPIESITGLSNIVTDKDLDSRTAPVWLTNLTKYTLIVSQ
ncbi:Hypothetical protein GLP15_3410 [Giardia lamblia P15]|uniref:RHD domain-containing protein n=1 Tax=Giardia intestinalis (strain P15) TaxID=658858 RepID=E1F3L6_GIAIA|nr:Hypothetical protein GLP15_3410 [Giardia lamblia P15]